MHWAFEEAREFAVQEAQRYFWRGYYVGTAVTTAIAVFLAWWLT